MGAIEAIAISHPTLGDRWNESTNESSRDSTVVTCTATSRKVRSS